MIVTGSAGGPTTGAAFTAGVTSSDAVTMPVPQNTVWLLEACAVGRDQSTGDIVCFTRQQAVRRAGGSPVMVASLGNILSNLDLSLTGANLSLAISGDGVAARVLGVLGRNIDWSVSLFVKAAL